MFVLREDMKKMDLKPIFRGLVIAYELQCISSTLRQKDLTGYCFKYIDRPFYLLTDDLYTARGIL